MRRVVFDSNAVDPLADRAGAYEVIEEAVQAGTLEILYTHVNIDELVEIPNVDRRATLVLLLAAVGRVVPTGTAAVDFSRVNFCRVGADEDEDVMTALRSGNIDHTRDALIASTAIFEKCALVTNEKRLTNRSRERGIEVLSSRDLFAELGFDLDAAPVATRLQGT
ncbi:rRNA-processing protein FCF1 [Streptomyces sp. SAI-208]|uniref:hypothetical protein n=1 Tax=Streptomyces sp. SAI-208 TaxID=2940550 RepID=UPI002475AC06|nr:hypothetical protein [Streptomyces sp. SAI-208]MDH6610349.1 rRNA-processing protein FCF1 [Streptomyces sp. SAI-208]